MRQFGRGHGHSGFTLVELMAVIAIVGVLATIAVYGTRRYITYSKASEAIPIIGSIKAAQEAYKDETFSYLNVTGSLETYYPDVNTTPGQAKAQWGGGDETMRNNWAVLGVHPAGPVYFVYSCFANNGASAPPSPSTESAPISIDNWPSAAPNAPYYVVKARADLDSTTTLQTVYVAPSFSNQIFSANVGE